MAHFSTNIFCRIILVAFLSLVVSSCAEKEPDMGTKLAYPSYNNDICLNEISTEEDFIELYNGSPFEVDLKGWSIWKNGEEAFRMANNAPLKPGQYATINFGENRKTYPGIRLGHSEEGLSGKKSLLLELRNPVGRRIDYFANTAAPNPTHLDKWGKNGPEREFVAALRYADGAEKWYAYSRITPGSNNVMPLKLVEFSGKTVDFDISPSDIPQADVKEGVKYLFDDNYIPEVTLEVSLAEWNKLLKNYDSTDGRTKDYIACDLKLKRGADEYQMDNIGVRLRGQTSRRRPEGWNGRMHSANNTDWHHCHFILDLNKFVDDADHEIQGVRKIVLKWHKDDPVYARERFCYDLLKRYGIWTAIADTYCRVWIHVEGDSKAAYFGVYQMMENVDGRFIKARQDMFGDEKGFLWKCGTGANLMSSDMADSKFKFDDNSLTEASYEFKGEQEDYEMAKRQLKSFISCIGGKSGSVLKTWANSVMDVKLLMRTFAAMVACGHWDEYWGNQNNYYMYFSGTDEVGYRFFYIPYDFDNTLGTGFNLWWKPDYDPGKQDPMAWGPDWVPFIKKLLEIPEFRQYYVDALHELASTDNDYFHYEASKSRILKMQDSIRPYLNNDTHEDTSISDHPASWGNHPEYRVLEDCEHNFFKVKCATMAAVK